MFILRNKLKALAQKLLDNNNEFLVLADDENDLDLLSNVAYFLVNASNNLIAAAELVDDKIEKNINKNFSEITSDNIDEIAALAAEFDSSDDEFLQKQASVLDQVLLNLGVKQTREQVEKLAQEESDKLRNKCREDALERAYKFPSEEHQRDIKSAEKAEEIKKSVKEYRPLETSLSVRYCPDHPGTSAMRIGDYTYQCPLDKKVYNWQTGFTTLKGNQVPGTDVQNQTQALVDRVVEQMHFSTRETALNQ